MPLDFDRWSARPDARMSSAHDQQRAGEHQFQCDSTAKHYPTAVGMQRSVVLPEFDKRGQFSAVGGTAFAGHSLLQNWQPYRWCIAGLAGIAKSYDSDAQHGLVDDEIGAG